ncbi:MAG: ferrochelatase [Ignavibacteriales bacterium]|nr:ferrochelatase [Ignavibacteriales bacterium]
MSKSLAKFISKKRAPKVQKEYKLIGGSSPINMWTEKQRLMLQTDLLKNNFDAEVFVAMRYWKPLTSETAKIVAAKKFDKIVLLPLYPHFSISTTGSSFNEWKRVYGGEASNLIYINSYPTNKYYLRAINQRIDESLLNFPEGERENVQLVFSAHGTPVSYVKKGDPYSRQIKETMEAVMKLRNHSHDYHLCFQSKVGPAKWLEPSTSDKIKELSLKGKNICL